MSNTDNEQSPADVAAQAISGLGQSLKRGLDRVGFEADKLLRTNRIRGEAQRLEKQADGLMEQIGEKVLELEAEGAELEPSLRGLVDQVRAIRKSLAEKAAEVRSIQNEVWVEPPPDSGTPQAIEEPNRPALPAGGPQVIEGEVVKRGKKSRQPKAEPEPEPAQSVRLCPNCGGPLRPVSIFCPNCGYKL